GTPALVDVCHAFTQPFAHARVAAKIYCPSIRCAGTSSITYLHEHFRGSGVEGLQPVNFCLPCSKMLKLRERSLWARGARDDRRVRDQRPQSRSDTDERGGQCCQSVPVSPSGATSTGVSPSHGRTKLKYPPEAIRGALDQHCFGTANETAIAARRVLRFQLYTPCAARCNSR